MTFQLSVEDSFFYVGTAHTMQDGGDYAKKDSHLELPLPPMPQWVQTQRMAWAEQVLPSVCGGGCGIHDHGLQRRLEHLYRRILFNNRGWKKIVYINETQEAAAGYVLLATIYDATQLQSMASIHLP